MRRRRQLELLALVLAAPPSLVPESFPRASELAAAALAAAVLASGLRAVAASRPLLYWIAVALPLSLGATPLFWEVSWPHLIRLVWGMALALLVARRWGGRRRDGLRLRAYLALGVLALASHERFAANELAGVLVLFLPLTLALALSPALDVRKRSLWRLGLIGLTLLFAVGLERTESRGGLLAAGLAICGVAWLAGRRGRWLLVAGALASILALATFGVGRLFEFLVHGGGAQGFSTTHLLTGRPLIWQRAWLALADFPFSGLGLGTFGASIGPLYAYPHGPLEDAHCLYLQTALDLGVPGLVAFLIFVGALARRLRAALAGASTGSLRHAHLLGLLGSLAAHLLYGVADAVSLGSLGGVAWWFLCGLALAATRGPDPAREPMARKMNRPPCPATRWPRALVAGALGVALAGSPWLLARGRHNRAAVTAASALVADAPLLEAAAARLMRTGTSVCRGRWLLGLVASRQSRPQQRDAAWADLIECSPAFLDLLQIVARHDLELARRAARRWDEDARAHFWLARAEAARGQIEEAEARYRRGLTLRPSDALAWVELANLLAGREPREALAAYTEACRRGDPGANACVRGGAVAERLGDVDTALRLYRMSRWAPSRTRADELERRRAAD